MKRDIYVTYFLFFVIVSPFIFLVPDEAAASQIEVTLTLEDPLRTARVGPGEHCYADFTGIVHFNASGMGPNFQTITVKLEADAGDWDTTIGPEEIEFDRDDDNSAGFSVVVRVPYGTSSKITNDVTISGYFIVEPGGQTYSIEPVHGIVSIHPYVILSINCSVPYWEVKGGDHVDLPVSIENEGNTDVTAYITIRKEEFLKDEGFQIEYPKSVQIMEGGTVDIVISIEIPDAHEEKIIVFSIYVKSEEENGTIDDVVEYTVFFRVKPDGFDDFFEDYSYHAILGCVVLFLPLILIWFFHRRRRKRREAV